MLCWIVKIDPCFYSCKYHILAIFVSESIQVQPLSGSYGLLAEREDGSGPLTKIAYERMDRRIVCIPRVYAFFSDE